MLKSVRMWHVPVHFPVHLPFLREPRFVRLYGVFVMSFEVAPYVSNVRAILDLQVGPSACPEANLGSLSSANYESLLEFVGHRFGSIFKTLVLPLCMQCKRISNCVSESVCLCVCVSLLNCTSFSAEARVHDFFSAL